TRLSRDWNSDVCSSDLGLMATLGEVSAYPRPWGVTLQTQAEDHQWYQQTGQAGQEQIGNHLMCGDLATDPEHGGGHVTNGRPGAAGVCGNHHYPHIQPALRPPPYQLAQQRDHDDGGGQVIQYRREEEGQQADDPQQRYAPAGG